MCVWQVGGGKYSSDHSDQSPHSHLDHLEEASRTHRTLGWRGCYGILLSVQKWEGLMALPGFLTFICQ